ncbi:hypothetical protein [Neobacillus sp. SAB-20_R2A]|uniref:hypothetical protein n=1 Tax=Neobacillus sp. SAB-20_R2A TaxID=3120519 RepID=UPI003C6E35F1
MKSFSKKKGDLDDWELFEIECPSYLNKVFQHIGVTFKGDGSKNSVASDIKVLKGDKYLFSIEAKFSPSQSGQFVVIETNDLYNFSPENKFENNKYSQAIIDFLNENKPSYSPKGQKAIEIKLDKDVLVDWIQEHYKRKDSYFIITSNKLNDFKVILSIDDIQKYFYVSAVIRRKPSGTSEVPNYKIDSCLSELKKHINKFGVNIQKVSKGQGSSFNKTLVEFDKNVELKRSERYFGEEYYLSPIRNGYNLKNRSKTNNLTVIFSLKYDGPEKNLGHDLLEKCILNRLK